MDYPSGPNAITRALIRGTGGGGQREDVGMAAKVRVGQGREPRNAGRLQKLAKARQGASLRASRGSPTLPTP